jgi:hypothetical protein
MKSYRAGVAATPQKKQKIMLKDNIERKKMKYTKANHLP